MVLLPEDARYIIHCVGNILEDPTTVTTPSWYSSMLERYHKDGR